MDTKADLHYHTYTIRNRDVNRPKKTLKSQKFKARNALRSEKNCRRLHMCTNFLLPYPFNVYKHGVFGCGIYETLKKDLNNFLLFLGAENSVLYLMLWVKCAEFYVETRRQSKCDIWERAYCSMTDMLAEGVICLGLDASLGTVFSFVL